MQSHRPGLEARPLDPESKKLTIGQGYQPPTLVIRKGLRTVFMTTEVHYKENLITMNLIIIFTILEFCHLELESTSLKTEGQLHVVGMVQYFQVKVYLKGRRAPGNLLLLNKFQKSLNSSHWLARKIFFARKYRTNPTSCPRVPEDVDSTEHQVTWLVHHSMDFRSLNS